MAGIDRYMNVLNLFGTEKSLWTVIEVSTALQTPSSTIYRTLRELVDAQMLDVARDGQYRLGPAFIDFDRRARLTDPLLQAASPMLTNLVEHAGLPCAAILARLYGSTVMCVADAKGPGPAVQTSYERGRPMPLTRGATSKAILAQLPSRRLNKILATLPQLDNENFRKELSTIRKAGYSIARGEVDAGRIGIAVPISVPDQALVASLSLVIHAASAREAVEQRLVMLLLTSVTLLKEQIAAIPPPPDA